MKVLLIDDHPLILSALKSVIQGVGRRRHRRRRRQCEGGAPDAQARCRLRPGAARPALGDADGFEVLTEFRNAYPALPVVVVSASDRASDVIRAIDLGAMGFVPKRATNDTLFQALRLVMSGGIYVPPMTLGTDAGPGCETVPAAVMHRTGRRRWPALPGAPTSNRSASRRARPTCSRCCCRASRTS